MAIFNSYVKLPEGNFRGGYSSGVEIARFGAFRNMSYPAEEFFRM